MRDEGSKVEWGDDCPVCKAKKSIIADVAKEEKAVVLRCLKCHSVFRK